MGRATEAIQYWNQHKRSEDDKSLITHYDPKLNKADSNTARKLTRKGRE